MARGMLNSHACPLHADSFKGFVRGLLMIICMLMPTISTQSKCCRCMRLIRRVDRSHKFANVRILIRNPSHMSQPQSENENAYLRLEQIVRDNSSGELFNLPAMRPYDKYIEALMKNQSEDAALARIAELPLESRYLWRILSALKWAFADFDSVAVMADRDTLPTEDIMAMRAALELQATQFCILLGVIGAAQSLEKQLRSELKMVRRISERKGFASDNTSASIEDPQA